MQRAVNGAHTIGEPRFPLEGLTPQTPGLFARIMAPIIRWISRISPVTGARLAQILPEKSTNPNGEVFSLQSSLRSPGGLQATRVLYAEPVQTYPAPASKAERHTIGEGVLNTVSRLERQGYAFQGQALEPVAALTLPDTTAAAALKNASATEVAAATKINPFKLLPGNAAAEPAPLLQPF